MARIRRRSRDATHEGPSPASLAARCAAGAVYGAALAGTFGTLLGVGTLLRGTALLPLELLLAMARIALGATAGGALGGAIIGAALPAVHDRLVAIFYGVVATGAVVSGVLLASQFPRDAELFHAAAALGITVTIGTALGFFVRTVVTHGRTDPGRERAANSILSRLAVWLAARRRRRPRRDPDATQHTAFPPEWRDILLRGMPAYRALDADSRTKLERQIARFVSEKTFEGCGGLELTDEIRVTIAAHACLLTLGTEAHNYPRLKTVLVYPAAYVPVTPSLQPLWQQPAEVHPRLGESWSSGVVVLSWNSVRGGAANVSDGDNVALHEFAHQLDQEDGGADGLPLLECINTYRTWARVLQDDFARHTTAIARQRKTVLGEYGAKNPAEFFAVATECFFEKPKQLRSRHPELYAVLCDYYGQDPASRTRLTNAE